MTGIFRPVFSIESSEGLGGFLPGLLGVGGADELPPLGDSILGDQLHADRVVGSHEVDEGGVEALALVFAVELPCGVLVELEHLEVGDGELLLSGRDHLAEVQVGVGLQHAVGPAWRGGYLLEVSSPTSSFRVN